MPFGDVGSRVGEGDLLEGKHGWRELAALWKVQLERLLRLGRRREPGGFHLVENLLLGVGLLHHVGVGAAARDELPQVLDVRLLLVVLLLLDDVISLQRLLVGVVVAGVVLQLAVGQADDVRAHAVEEILRVRDDQQALVVLRQVVLEPHTRAQIKVVRGLVQQQQRWRREERTRERHAHAPPSGHVLRGALHHLAAKAQPIEQLSRACLERGGVQLLEPLVYRLQTLVARPARRERGRLQLLQALHLELDVVDDGFERRAVRRLGFLAQVEDVHVLRDGYLAVGQRGEQVALTAAVYAQQPVPPAHVELDVAVVDELLAVHLHAKLRNLDVERGGPRREHPSHRPVHVVVHTCPVSVDFRGGVVVLLTVFYPRFSLLDAARALGGVPRASPRPRALLPRFPTLLCGRHLALVHAPRVRAQVRDEPGVVGHGQHAPLELAKSLGERLEGLVVQIVRRLVQRDDVGFGPHRGGQDQPRLLPAGHALDLPVGELLRDAKVREVRVNLRAGQRTNVQTRLGRLELLVVVSRHLRHVRSLEKLDGFPPIHPRLVAELLHLVAQRPALHRAA